MIFDKYKSILITKMKNQLTGWFDNNEQASKIGMFIDFCILLKGHLEHWSLICFTAFPQSCLRRWKIEKARGPSKS